MELKNQVVSLELAKQLKKLGFKQKSIFRWIIVYDSYEPPILNHNLSRCPGIRGDLHIINMEEFKNSYSAYTASELYNILLEILNKVEDVEYFRNIELEIKTWKRFNLSDILDLDIIFPNKMAKLLIHLKENNLI